jgi:hypothetical protein
MFLGDKHLIRYMELFGVLLAANRRLSLSGRDPSQGAIRGGR